MKYQKIINPLGDTKNQRSKIRTKEWVEMNDNTNNRRYDNTGQFKLKSAMIRSSFGDYSDAYILVKVTLTITGAVADVAARNAEEMNFKFTRLHIIYQLHKLNK